VDIQVRTRADFLIWCESKLKNLKLNKVKIYEVVDFPGGTSVNQFLRFKKGLAIQYFYLRLVDDSELLQRYEQLSLSWKSQLPTQLKEELERKEEEKEEKKKELRGVPPSQKLKCPFCNYTWVPHGPPKLKPMCPSCRRIFKLVEAEQQQAK
jgi:hypothetical protein